jgi:hypothetical protein
MTIGRPAFEPHFNGFDQVIRASSFVIPKPAMPAGRLS